MENFTKQEVIEFLLAFATNEITVGREICHEEEMWDKEEITDFLETYCLFKRQYKNIDINRESMINTVKDFEHFRWDQWLKNKNKNKNN